MVATEQAGVVALPALAPYVTATTDARDGARLALHLGERRLCADLRDGSVSLTVPGPDGEQDLRSRRFHRAASPAELGLTLTGEHVTAWTREDGHWVARARHDLREPGRGLGALVDVRDEGLLAGLRVELPDGGGRAGPFGQLGLRDVRVVTDEDGSPVRDGDDLWLSATSAGPGFFDTAHTSVWRLHTTSYDLTHTADLFFRRPDVPGVFGDHATHLVRSGPGWLVATSTWGDFEVPSGRAARRTPSGLRVTLAESSADLLDGTHVLDTRELPLPVDGLGSIATWDPHLVRHDGGWLVGFVSARRFFDFHPALAGGQTLDSLTLLGAAADRSATEGTTVLRVDGEVRVLASDGRDSRRGQRARYPVLDTAMREVGLLDAPYPSNLPWPSLAQVGDDWLMATFDGRRAGGELLGYGTHGDLVLMRSGGRG